MKKFTKLWQLMVIVLLTTSVAFGQNAVTVKDSQAGKTGKKALEQKQKVQKKKSLITEEFESQVINSEVDPNPVATQQNVETTSNQNVQWKNISKDFGNDPSNIIDPSGPNYNVKGELDCPPGSQFSQSCVGYSTGVTSELDPGYSVYQYYSGLSEDITSITYWGLNLYHDGTGWSACTEDPMPFEISFYGDNAGAPDLTNLLATYSPTLTAAPTGEMFAGAYEIMRYTYTFGTAVAITDAWIMIQGQGSTTCWFLWVDSGTTGTFSYQDDGTGPAVTTYVQSLCLGGGLLNDDVGVTAITQPNTGLGLGLETVEVEITNFGANAESNFDVFYQIDGGAPVTETFTGTINSGDVASFTFATLADLSAIGTYAIHACTDLTTPADENPTNDCSDKSVENFPLTDCDWYIVGFDDFGDSWNGGYIDIYINTILMYSWTGPASAGPDTVWFGIYDPCTIDIVWNAGGWPYEASYYVYSNLDVLVASDGVGGVDPVGITGLAGTCAVVTCPAPTAQTATNVSSTSADLGWTETGTATTWEIELGPTGFVPTGFGTAVAVNPYPYGGLAPGITYDWYVKATCSAFDHSLWTGPHTFATPGIIPDLLYQFDADAITLDPRNLGVEYFNGSLWITGATDGSGTNNRIYEIDYTTSTLLNSYPQGTTTAWGMRDMANDGALLYASDGNGFYSINPTTGVVTTVFNNTAPIFGVISPLRALAYDGANFWTKSFGSDLYCFDIAGNIIAGPFVMANSAYGMAYDASVPCLWLHASGGATGNEMVQVDMAGALTGVTVPVPVHPCGPAAGSVGGAFMDFGNMYTGRDVFGVLDQASPDVVKIFTAYDTGFPGQTSNHVPTCGATGIPTSGTLTWDFGANTVTYDVWLGPAGAMVQVVTGAAVGGPSGSYAYSGLTASIEYEWRVDGYNTADLGPTNGLVSSFTTSCGTFIPPVVETFPVQADPMCWTNTSSNPVANGLWEYGNATTNSPGYGTSGTPDHTPGGGGFYAWADGSTPVVADITLLTPMIDISGLTSPELIFFILSNNTTNPGDNCTFYCDFYDGAAWNNVVTYAGDNANWIKYAIDLTPYTITGDVQVRFIVDQTTATTAFYNDILLDDISVAEAVACPDPSGLGATNITQATADLTWTSNSGLSDIEFGLAGFTPIGAPTYAGVTSPYGVAGLSGTTGYDFYVRDDCGGGVTSNWVGPYTFYTPPDNDECVNAEAVTAPYPTVATGTTNGATVDCPTSLNWDAVWYAIDLPYDYNFIELDLCLDIVEYEYDFDALTVGGLVAGQLGGMWTTWSGTPADDATVSDTYSNSPSNSFVVDAGAVDLIYQLDAAPIATGHWMYSHYMYIPTGFSGYFNVQSDPTPGVAWVVEVFFNDDGTGNIDQEGTATGFTYTPDSWFLVEIDFDLDGGSAEVFFDGTSMYQWSYTSTIGGIDYFGWDAGGTPGAYYDDVAFVDVGTTLSNTGIILTADCSCDASSFIYSTGAWTVTANCMNDLNFLVAGPGTVYYPVMTDPKGDFAIDINVTAYYGLDGTLTYANAATSAMELTTVTIDDGTDAIVGTTMTDLTGYYQFGFLAPGSYTLDGSTDKAWGGVTTVDGILVKRFALGLMPLNALQQLAADVNLTGVPPTTIDGILITRRALGLLASWPAPDYVFENPTATIVGGNVTQDFQSLCSGDVNGSYTPPVAPPGAVCDNAIPLAY
ncbi:MAG: hypothetical protein K8R37_03740, partial [Bacteroidales bacterium]|nr:hypothetical protein [Bacteroidales bacterium]